MTTLTNNKTTQPHKNTHQKTTPNVQTLNNKQGTIQMLNRTQLVSTTQTTDNKNIQQHTPDVIGHTHTYRNTNTEQQPNSTTEDQNDRGADDTAGTPTNPQEEDFPQSPCVVSNTRNCSAASPSANDRDTKLQKFMEKVKTNQTGIPRRKVKQISPLHIAPRSVRKR